MEPWKPSAPGTVWLLLLHSPRMAAWHFWLALPFGCCAGNPVHWIVTARSLYQISSSVLTPNCARYALPQHAARPGTQLQFSGTFDQAFQLWKYLKEWLQAGHCGRERTGPASLKENTATIGSGLVRKVSGKSLKTRMRLFLQVTQCFGNALKIYTWTASPTELLAHSSDAPKLRTPLKRALSKQWLVLLYT